MQMFPDSWLKLPEAVVCSIKQMIKVQSSILIPPLSLNFISVDCGMTKPSIQQLYPRINEVKNNTRHVANQIKVKSYRLHLHIDFVSVIATTSFTISFYCRVHTSSFPVGSRDHIRPLSEWEIRSYSVYILYYILNYH